MSGSEPDNSALLLVGTHCPYCPGVRANLDRLLHEGVLSSLEVVNIEEQPHVAESYGVRSVPWVKIGPFELDGLRTRREYMEWIERTSSVDGLRLYIEELLTSGEVDWVSRLIERDFGLLSDTISLMEDPDAKINIRLGIGVIMENFAAVEAFKPYIEQLIALVSHADARVRADAAHYLSLTNDQQVKPVLQSLLQDEDAEVREVAQDGLEELATSS